MNIKRKLLICLLSTTVLMSLSGCKKWLDREPTEILLEDEVWGDPELARSVLANLYNRLQPFGGLEGGKLSPTDVDEAMWSGGLGGNNDRNTRVNYPYNIKQYWDYGLIRDVTLFLENIEASTLIQGEDKLQLLAEGRFIRAFIYFLHVRSMGGVPLILRTYQYSGPDDVAGMREPRSTEAGIYDFIASELDAIQDQLPQSASSRTRANKWTVLALKSRAMLYAASTAKYNNLMTDPILTANGEIGIPADRAAAYYEQSLLASKEILEQGPFALYRENPDLTQNFYDLFTNKNNNPEIIWAFDYTLDGKYHDFTVENIPRSLRESASGGAGVTPSLNIVEAFDYLDGSSGTLNTHTADESDYIYYDQLEDIFAGKDYRMMGSIITPGSLFRQQEMVIQAGVMEWDETAQRYMTRTSGNLGSYFSDGGFLVGPDGPLPNAANVTNTGFYIKKYLDSRVGSGQIGQGSDLWWIRFRLGEILLNASEAAFELGLTNEALTYVNRLRERAGFEANSLQSLTIATIQKEFQTELAFEEHRFWDLKRWRIAHEVFDGNRQSPHTMIFALWPYRVVRPNDPTKHNKYVFEKRIAPRFTQPRNFRLGNYYSLIPQDALNSNPLLTRNPFH
ncbi:RagB/SusD family nutrient uptake outer membrane protein [Olivibacter sp. SDN3]|uniref:RagB/SusD family nutrient uptake outer membrane protein n=1 Tax=Olivibacter sp. SDN3 TaxID=2764720 RepID=UPI00165167AD|nr:RagB/SusD family nutrient uptake outer membrane protein [Olivibacter sp. SDN3]QNL47963.1 RagB/SusD family nutrient uptake outer membrane protein [Olivibacter sp. SDN3]